MRLFDKVKQYAFTAMAVLAIGAVAAGGVDVQAKTVNEPNQTTKRVAEIGDSFELEYVTNLKINGKKYSKGSIKKKVKTVSTRTYARAYKAYTGSYVEYLDNTLVYDKEDLAQQKENFKYITVYDYTLDFLKAGTYKISYDTYSTADDEVVKSPDGKTETVTPVLEKTHHVDTVKVMNTTQALKSITLGKSKVTWSYKRSGSKVTTQRTVKNRYLTGNSGKLTMKFNKNYKLTSAFAITRDAAGYVQVTATGNKQTVAYSQGKYSDSVTYDKVVQDATGKDVVVNGLKQRTPAVVSETNSKYKETEIVYGYKNSYTGDYTNYTLSARNIFIPKLNEKEEIEYQKDAAGNYIYDQVDGSLIPITIPVQATVITKAYPTQTYVNGVYQTVEVVEEMVFIPGAKSFYEHDLYYFDAQGNNYSWSGEWDVLSKAGIAHYVALADGSTKVNPAYTRAFYTNDTYYAGTWVPYNETMQSGTYDDDSFSYDFDATGKNTVAWVYQYVIDPVTGEKAERAAATNYVYGLGNASASWTFRAK